MTTFVNTMKFFITTDNVMKRNKNDEVKFSSVAINRDSQICYINSTRKMKNLEKSKYVTVTALYMKSFQNGLFITLTDTSKVCEFIFIVQLYLT